MVAATVDVGALIDERQLSRLQIVTFVLCALIALLDGVDSQAIGVAGPLMAAELHVKMSGFAPVISAGLFGATIGALTFGPISDRYGRKPTLVGATVLFGAFTLLTPAAWDMTSLIAIRFIAGLGLGGATPCFITLAADYAPKRRRAMLASLLWSAYPLGNAVGGFMTSFVVSRYDWRTVFYVGAVPTLVAAAALVAFLPESLRFLASTGRDPEGAARLARRLDPNLPSGPLRMLRPDEAAKRVRWTAMFAQGRAASTLLLWTIFFLAFGTTTLIVLWTPTLLRGAGMPLSTTANLVGLYSLAAVAGMAVAGKLVDRVGAIAALVPAFVLGGGLLVLLGAVAATPWLAALCMVLLGLSIPLGAAGGVALAATYYPTEIRTSGVGWAMGLGRFGQVCSPLAVGLMLSLDWLPAQILTAMAVAPVLAGMAVLLRTMLEARRPLVSVAA